MPALDDLLPLDNPAFHSEDHLELWARLRKEAPVYWHNRLQTWVVSRYEDVKEVSRNRALFSSAHGLFVGQNFSPNRDHHAPEPNIVGTDAPIHTRLRGLCSRAFTPRLMASLEPTIREMVVERFELIEPGSTIDFVSAVTAPVPIYAIGALLGVPRGDWEQFRRWSDDYVEAMAVNDTEANTILKLIESYFRAILEERRSNPCEDLISAMAKPSRDGQIAEDADILALSSTLLLAGNETTRNTVSLAAVALQENLEQRRRLIEQPDLFEQAVDELLRYVTPVFGFCRTSLGPSLLGDQRIGDGDYVLMVYASANRDEAVWENAERLDVGRPLDPRHVSFGFGEHFCVGAHLARLEIRVMLEELLGRFPAYETGNGTRIHTIAVRGYKDLPIHFKAPAESTHAPI